MQDADLFLSLAGIAGVFVGFGALIAVRGGGASEVDEIALMRTVVSTGVMTIVAALAPVTFARYDLPEHQVWLLSSVLVLVGFLAMAAANARRPEYRAVLMARTPGGLGVVADGVSALAALLAVLAPIAIVLGLLPELEAALYFTVVVLILLSAGWVLLSLVFSRRPTTA